MIILIAEDNKDIQKMLTRKLSKQGWEFHITNNGKECMEKAWELKPDLILMDMHMPVMDGHEATRTLRADGYAGKIAAFTASVMHKNTQSALKDGCDYIIAKPVDKSFISRIKEIIDKPITR